MEQRFSVRVVVSNFPAGDDGGRITFEMSSVEDGDRKSACTLACRS